MKPETEYTFPVVHLNGTNGQDLLKEYEEANNKLFDFMAAWGNITCNARDYYVKGPEAFDAAINDRVKIGAKILDIKQYLQAHMIDLHDQLTQR